MRTIEPQQPDEGIPYVDVEDHLNREIIRINGFSIDAEDLVTVLSNGDVVLRAAAAHTLGSDFPAAAASALPARLTDDDDLVSVEAAYALARSGDAIGMAKLVSCLKQPIETGIAAPLAAGYLARLGDPSGYNVVARGLELDILAIRMVACKQISFYVPFEGWATSSEVDIDAYQLFRTALDDTDAGVQWEALVQLCWIDSEPARQLLVSYRDSDQNDNLRDLATRALAGEYGAIRAQEEDR